jgi:ATP-dependent Lon protease
MTDQPDERPPVEIDTEKIPELLSILPLFDAALFPKMVLPLVVMQGESVRLVDEAMAKNRIIGLVVSQKPEDGNKPESGDLAQVGTSALILKMAKTQDNRTQLLVQGLHRFRIKSWENRRPYLRARIELVEENEVKDNETEALMTNLIEQFIRIVELSAGLPPEIGQMAKSIQEAGTLADMIASTINSSPAEKQKILEIQNVKERLKEVTRLVNHQLSILELGNKIQSQVKGDMDQSQKERNWAKQMKARLKLKNTGPKLKKEIFLKKRAKKPSANWIVYHGCIRPQPNIRLHQPIWTGSPLCRGTKAPRIMSTSKRPKKSWMMIIMGWRNPNGVSLNIWQYAN